MDQLELEVVFPPCPGDSPAYHCCGTQGLIEQLDKEIEKQQKVAAAERKWKSLSLPKSSKKLALSLWAACKILTALATLGFFT